MFKNLSPREKSLTIICFTLCLALGITIQTTVDVNASSKNSDIYDELQTFTDVLAIAQSDYVSEPNNKEIIAGAIKGMLATLDPHSNYLDPSFYEDLEIQTKGRFGGLGIEISMKDGMLLVVSPMEDSPAIKVGVQAGDYILKINDEFTKDFSLNDAIAKLRGPIGEPVKISVQRKGINKLIEFSIVRDTIKIQSIRKRYLQNDYGYVRIAQFMENSANDLKNAIEELEKSNGSKPLKGLILDFRNNPGGLLTQAVRISDMFLEEGVIVYTKGRIKDQQQRFYAKKTNDELTYPVVVLVNGGSASASEIVAAALKDHGRALVVGTQTFGKGSVQTVTPLNNGGALTLTTALYYTKSGNSIQGEGVVPDIEVEPKPIDPDKLKTSEFKGIRESELPKAISNPNNKGDSGTTPLQKINQTPTVEITEEPINPEKTALKDWLERDLQMAKAVEVLKNFEVFSKK